ncbi:hypothetical protein [Sphingobium sp. CCH11-B1]|nr:hypothetical protein [Sphingobium sp. CCH11-B1]MEA3389978.1 hypothetical protein [Pseudomonadota bacterium]
MSIVTRLLDWLCSAFAAGAQDALRINQLICPFSEQPGRKSHRE